MNAACRFRTFPSSRVGDLDEVPAEATFSARSLSLLWILKEAQNRTL